MSLEKLLKNSKNAVLLGIGGGGDIVGTLPTANFLKLHGITSILGGLAWERSVFDPVPGPRKFKEVSNVKTLNEVVWKANKNSSTITGVKFAESGVSEVTGKETLLVDINHGPDKVAEGLLDACKKLNADILIGIDVGGDAVAFGHENGLASPLADAIMTSALYKLNSEIPTLMGIFGFGSDGELTLEELENSFKTIAQNNGLLGSWGMTLETLKLMKEVIEVVKTEASRLPVEYALGNFKNALIRSGTRKVELNLCSTATFYIDTNVVFKKISKPAQTVFNCHSLEEANTALNKIGIKTELDLENEKYKEKNL
ncbi:MAG: DUF1152 domain-containing protein [Candidatus Dadabacteria bacterium]|nr:DUF1152 domain-containing protein [Candidatus Dadabacteria bacterium]NIQ14031.1 DUF1152 domain-containing protein [Candidatus Dadabacteria bacterium]